MPSKLPLGHNDDVADSEATERQIARALLEARRRVGWTLAEAAAEVGVSVTHLSRLERAERQPSVGVLLQLARSYGLSLGQLVGEEAEAACRVFRAKQVPFHDGPDGRYAALSGITGAGLLEAIRLELPGGTRTSSDAQHPGEEWLLVQSGVLQIEVGSRALDLGPGDVVHFDAQAPHRLRNPGEEATIVFIVSAGVPARRTKPHR